MKRTIIALILTAMMTACGQTGSPVSERRSVPLAKSSPVPVTESTESAESAEPAAQGADKPVKAVWLSYIDLAPLLTGTENEFTAGFEEVCRNCKELGLNTLYVHVRPFGDALYRSKLFPPSEYVPKDDDGNILFDPLKIMTETAHSYELSVHAWINPLRLQSEDSLSSYSDCYQTVKWYESGEGQVNFVEGDAHLWLDPSHSEVRKLIAEGASEICGNYDVDGIHYDDYFYPTTDADFDAECFSVQDSYSDLAQYRLDCVSQMCAEIYSAVKSVDENIEVGISPQGNIENNYQFLYADVERWLTEDGYCDCMIPQIYYGYDNTVKPYLDTLNTWREIDKDKKLVIGLAVYKIGSEDEFTDTAGIISRQAEDALNVGCQGYALYNYISLFEDSDRMSEERSCILSDSVV